MKNEVYIFDSLRSPRGKGKSDGSLHTVKPIKLASELIQFLIFKNDLQPDDIEDILLGCANQTHEQAGCIAKAVAQFMDFNTSIPGVTFNRFGGSSLEAVHTAAARIQCGQESLLVAGGVESSSRIRFGQDGGPLWNDPEVTFKSLFLPPGIAADLLATLKNYSRFQLDKIAFESHQKAINAQKNDSFKDSLFPIKDQFGQSYLSYDELVRGHTDMETLATLKPSFLELGINYGFDKIAISKFPDLEQIYHLHHPGNSAPLADGSAAILMGSISKADKFSLKPKAKIRSWAVIGTDPTVMFTGGPSAAHLALERANLNIQDIDIFEVNESYAAIPQYFSDELEIPLEKINVNGGAIALGHCPGAMGAILVSTLIDELKKRDQNLGMVNMSLFSGIGMATIIERIAD